MPTYTMLTELTPECVETIANHPSRIEEVNREIEPLTAIAIDDFIGAL